MNEAIAKHVLDVRSIAGRERHPLIFSAFRDLQVGETMELVNDHDPRPLYFQFQAETPGTFTWEYRQPGPETWRVAITRTAPAPAAAKNGCCGSCGGA